MGWTRITTVLVFALVLLSAGFLSAKPVSFTASDPTDLSNGDYDITAFGSTIDGNTVILWLEVRGNINLHPDEGYQSVYAIEIGTQDYSQVTVSIVAQQDSDGNTILTAYYVTQSSGGELSPDEYSASGNRLEFYMDAALFSEVSDDFRATATASLKDLTGSSTSWIIDTAEYPTSESGSSSGGSSGSSSSSAPSLPFGLLLWILIPLIVVIVVVVVVLLLVLNRGSRPPQPPTNQMPPQYPPQR